MKKLFIYSGHSEVVGGDVKFIVDYINVCPKDEFEIILYTDKHCHFESLSKKWLKRDITVQYLPTKPIVFSEHFPLNILNSLEKNVTLGKILKKEFRGKSIKHLIDFAVRIITLYDYRIALWNLMLFLNVFSKHSSIDTFLFNNGGYPAKIAGLSAVVAARLKGISNTVMIFHNIPAPRRPLSVFDRLMDKLVNNSLSHIVAVSEILKRELVSRRGFNPNKITVSYCGLEDESPRLPTQNNELKKSLNLPDNKIILITGNLNEKRKGHEFLIEALGIVKKSFPNFSLIIVGGGSDERKEEINQKLIQEKLVEQTYFLGHRFDIHNINSISDIVVVPSIGVEATPYTIKEGYRASRPVITTSKGGCAEGVLEGKTGFVVEAENSPMLADRLLRLLNNEEMCRQFGENGRFFYLDKFELQAKGREINSVIRNEKN